MKALLLIKGAGYQLTEFKPIASDWYSWEAHDKQIKIIHEKCYFKLVINHLSILRYPDEEGVCAFCGKTSPESIKQFIFLANATKEYK